MTHAAETTRRFRVYARHTDRHHARLIEEASFEAAAVAYLDDVELSVPINGDQELRVIVHDIGTGQEHCFKLDLNTGETTSCS